MVTLFAIRHIFVPNIPDIWRGAQLFIVLRRLEPTNWWINTPRWRSPT